MSLEQSTAPSTEAVSTADLKSWMRVDASDEDTLIGNLAGAARNAFETETHRQLITATWKLRLTVFPAGEIVLPVSPLQSVTSITYVDNDDVTQTVSSDDYDVDTKSTPGRIRPSSGNDWPSDSRGHTEDVIITFVAGYGDASSDVPDGITAAVKLLAAHWFENREASSVVNLSVLPLAYRSLVRHYHDGTVEASA